LAWRRCVARHQPRRLDLVGDIAADDIGDDVRRQDTGGADDGNDSGPLPALVSGNEKSVERPPPGRLARKIGTYQQLGTREHGGNLARSRQRGYRRAKTAGLRQPSPETAFIRNFEQGAAGLEPSPATGARNAPWRSLPRQCSPRISIRRCYRRRATSSARQIAQVEKVRRGAACRRPCATRPSPAPAAPGRPLTGSCRRD
jgi:hypothetical protein